MPLGFTVPLGFVPGAVSWESLCLLALCHAYASTHILHNEVSPGV